MSSPAHKKRNKPLQDHDAESRLRKVPRRENPGEDVPVDLSDLQVSTLNQKSHSRGAARQAKSERRSKKMQIVPRPPGAGTGRVESPRAQESGSDEAGSQAAMATGKKDTLISQRQAELENNMNEQGSPKRHKKSKGPVRFVVFVGNLPYSATTESIASHFAKLSPRAIRHRTDPQTGKSKGFAFLEFDRYDRMKTCLKLYHHSIFNLDKQDSSKHDRGHHNAGPGQQHQQAEDRPRTEQRGRRINVELTAGGGGGGSTRRAKIQEKNKRLEAQRKKTRKATRAESRGKAATKDAVGGNDGDPATHKGQTDKGTRDEADTHVHPSRRGRVGR